MGMGAFGFGDVRRDVREGHFDSGCIEGARASPGFAMEEEPVKSRGNAAQSRSRSVRLRQASAKSGSGEMIRPSSM